VAGLVDALSDARIKAFGPSKAAAQLEGSKGFTKDFCAEFSIPTASYRRFGNRDAAVAYVREQPLPLVVKADGLAAGKGVVIAETHQDGVAAVEACFDGAFGAAGAEVVIEECLVGEEASFFALVDGTHALPLVAAQDHKRAYDGEKGPNTGGMGAYSPAPVMTPEMTRRTMDEIVWPTVRGMAARGTPFKGVLFAGLMITDTGPKLIEYNVRFGDPECQVLMMRLKSDLLPALIATSDGVLKTFDLRWHDDAALTVVMASNGYPGDYRTGTEIRKLGLAGAIPGVEIFHAGTRRQNDSVIAAGGRVLSVSARGDTIGEAQQRAYEAVRAIDWPDGFYRTDIGWRAITRQNTHSPQ
jgi:phosphoribosylamine--glycine ligase